jgi:hypothetical protein
MGKRRLFLFILAVGSLLSCRRPTRTTVDPLVITIDPAVAPVPTAVPDDGKHGPRPIAAIRNEAGVITEFFANEVVIVPKSQSELDQFVAKYKGKIIGDNSVPTPPPALGKTLEPADAKATEYAVPIDPSGVDYNDFTALAGRKVGGKFTLSSEDAARLLAVTVRESANGLSVSPNFSQTSHAVLRATQEQPIGAGFADAFNVGQFPRFQQGGSRASVTAAWQWVQAHGVARRIRVAVIDGGFWLNSIGQPLPLATAGGTDLPAAPTQYDFVGDDFIAGAINPAACTGGSACPWHGNGSASVGAGRVNNTSVAAGTGGLAAAGLGGTIADVWLFHTDIRDKLQRDRAVRTAVAWGADIISMSFGGPCNYRCRSDERDDNTDRGYRDAVARGVVLVASAGNTGDDVGADNFYHPCITDGVICVGALADDTNVKAAVASGSAFNSNYGGGVDIWAPTNIGAITGGNASAPVLTTFGGTSASAPFIFGIAAMMKAINPALTSDQVRDMLRDTAWTDSPDGNVSHYVNALAAVQRASNGVLPHDRFESNDSAAAAKPINVGQNDDLTLHDASDRDYYKLTVGSPANVMITSTYSDMLGKPYVNFSKTDDCGGATQSAKTTQPNQQSWTYAVTPGQYLIQVSSGRALPYDLGITSTATALGRDIYEGVTNNDAFGRAFALGKGGGMYPATISPTGDIDFYQVDSTGSIFNPKVGGKRFIVSVVTADMPVSLDFYDAHQHLVRTLDTSPDCKVLPSLDLPAGRFFVRARAPSQGNYILGVGEKHDSGILYDMRALWRVLKDPSGPVQFVVDGPYDRFVYERAQERAGSINVTGSGLHATLLDSSGNVIAEGQPVANDGQASERIPLDGTVAGESYVVRLDRDIGVAPGKGMRLPRVIAKLSLAPR